MAEVHGELGRYLGDDVVGEVAGVKGDILHEQEDSIRDLSELAVAQVCNREDSGQKDNAIMYTVLYSCTHEDDDGLCETLLEKVGSDSIIIPPQPRPGCSNSLLSVSV